jgi:hypothetical protein
MRLSVVSTVILFDYRKSFASFSLLKMLLEASMPVLSAFLISTPAVLAADPEWMIDWWLFDKAPNCPNNPDITTQGYSSTLDSSSRGTECFNAPSNPQTVYLSYGGTTVLNLRMCFDPNCQSCHIWGPNSCWSVDATGPLNLNPMSYQVVYA